MEAVVTKSAHSEVGDELKQKAQADKAFRLKAGMFITAATVVSATIGGTIAMRIAKKKGAAFLADKQIKYVPVDQSEAVARKMHVPVTPGNLESGTVLALKALGWGTLLAISGCSLIFYGFWKWSGATHLKEFPVKIRDKLPKLSMKSGGGRTEFEDWRDLVSYLNESSKVQPKKKDS